MTAHDVIVVGGGHNALVCAAYLARAGLDTLLLERRERAGGLLVTARLSEDTRAPSAAHTVGRLHPVVASDLGLYGHGLRLVQPEVRVFAPQPDGEAVTLWGDPAATARELEHLFPREASAFIDFDDTVRALAGFMGALHDTVPPDLSSVSLEDGISALRLVRAFRSLDRDRARTALRVLPMPVADLVAEWFESDALRAAVAARGIQYTAMGPRSAGTTAVLLSDSVGKGGAAGQAVFATGGPGALADALASSARASGVVVRTSATVAQITTRRGRVGGVVLDSGEEVGARAVVSGIDPKRTLTQLLDPVTVGPTMGWRARNLRSWGALAKVNLELSGLPRFAAKGGDEKRRLQGRIVVAPGIEALERAFDDSKYGRMSDRPYLEATIPTLVDPALAPEGRHVMSVIAQYAPYRLRGASWDEERDRLGDLVLRALDGCAPGLSSMVEEREVLTPLDLERDFGLSGGHPLHLEPGLDQFFAWRPLLGHADHRLVVDGLYLCGSGSHPGGGIT
ncbi:MAG: phytoene desaturase family protein, partial [Actinomycetota bacterium]